MHLGIGRLLPAGLQSVLLRGGPVGAPADTVAFVVAQRDRAPAVAAEDDALGVAGVAVLARLPRRVVAAHPLAGDAVLAGRWRKRDARPVIRLVLRVRIAPQPRLPLDDAD